MTQKTKRVLLFLLLLSGTAYGQNLSVLTEKQREQFNYYKHLQLQAYELLNARHEKLANLTSSEAIQVYQEGLRAEFTRALGGFPKRSDLNSRVIKRTELKEYSIENIIFESQPCVTQTQHVQILQIFVSIYIITMHGIPQIIHIQISNFQIIVINHEAFIFQTHSNLQTVAHSLLDHT